MKEAGVRREIRTDWLGTLKALFGSSVNNKNEENELEIWKKQNQNILKENEASIEKLESMLVVQDREKRKSAKREGKSPIKSNTVKQVNIEIAKNNEKQHEEEEIEH